MGWQSNLSYPSMAMPQDPGPDEVSVRDRRPLLLLGAVLRRLRYTDNPSELGTVT
jgi:hypothetical protein